MMVMWFLMKYLIYFENLFLISLILNFFMKNFEFIIIKISRIKIILLNIFYVLKKVN